MMKIEFETDGGAFCDPHTNEPDAWWKGFECRRILSEIRLALDDGKACGSIIDVNGNKIGHWNVD